MAAVVLIKPLANTSPVTHQDMNTIEAMPFKLIFIVIPINK